MSLEETIKENTAAVVALTAAIKAGGGSTGGAKADKPAGGAKAADKKAKPKHSSDQVKAKILEVKEKKGQDRAAQVIADSGHEEDKLAGLLATPDDFDKAYDLAVAALAEEDDEDDGENEL